MSVASIRGRLVAVLTTAALLALVGCGAPAPTTQVAPFDLRDTTKIGQLSCGQLTLVKDKLDSIKGATAPGDISAFQRDWGVNPQNAAELDAAQLAIANVRVVKQCDSTPTPTPSAVPTPSASPTPTPTLPQATPTPSASTAPPVDQDFIVPANDEDIRAAEFNAFVARCGDKLWKNKKAKGDKTDFVVMGKGNAYTSWGSYTCLIAHYPTLGHSIVDGVVNQPVPSGSTVGKVNPWAPKFLAKSKGSLAKAWVVKDTRTGELTVSSDYLKYAFKVVTLLELFQRKDKMVATATWHYPANPTASGLPKTYKSKKPYTGLFIPLMYTLKGQSCPFAVYAINVIDGRFAKLAWSCGVPRTPGTPGTPGTPHKPPTTPPTHKPTPTPTPMPSKTSAPPNHGEPTSPPTEQPPSTRP